MKLGRLIILLLAITLIVAAATQAQAKTYTVSIKNDAFSPKELTIVKGDTITWTNEDAIQHNVDLDDLGKSPDLNKGGTYSKTFDKPGTYSYDCDIHPFMKGKVTVK